MAHVFRKKRKMTSQNVQSEASSETMIALDDMKTNDSCYTLAWENISYSVKDKKTKLDKQLISNMVIDIFLKGRVGCSSQVICVL